MHDVLLIASMSHDSAVVLASFLLLFAHSSLAPTPTQASTTANVTIPGIQMKMEVSKIISLPPPDLKVPGIEQVQEKSPAGPRGEHSHGHLRDGRVGIRPRGPSEREAAEEGPQAGAEGEPTRGAEEELGRQRPGAVGQPLSLLRGREIVLFLVCNNSLMHLSTYV